MDTQQLIEKYNAGEAEAADIQAIEQLLETGQISLTDLNDVAAMQQHLSGVEVPEHSSSMEAKFYQMLGSEKQKLEHSFANKWKNWWASAWQHQMQWAYSLVLVLVGGLSVYLWLGRSDQKFDQLSQEMTQMKEMMMLSMLEQSSTTERLKAVSLTNDMNEVSDKVSTALIQVLRNDENNSVRLAAVEALALYADNATVREGLIESIVYQDSPLVQLALAELMVALKERKSVDEFKAIIDSEQTPSEVKVVLEEAVETLI